MPSNSNERDSQIKVAIGWANPQHRIRDVKNLLDEADERGYKRGFKEAEALIQKEVKKEQAKTLRARIRHLQMYLRWKRMLLGYDSDDFKGTRITIKSLKTQLDALNQANKESE